MKKDHQKVNKHAVKYTKHSNAKQNEAKQRKKNSDVTQSKAKKQIMHMKTHTRRDGGRGAMLARSEIKH